MLVRDVMTDDVVTCSVTADLRQAAEAMLRHGVGSVVVHEDQQPTGIVTETDMLHAGYVTDSPFSEIPVRKTMSDSLVTITPEKTLRRATQLMEEAGVKKLVVVENLELVGIITTEDVIHHYHDLKAEIQQLTDPTKNPGRSL